MDRFVLGFVLLGLSAETGQVSRTLRSSTAILLSTEGEDVIPGPIWSAARTTVSAVFGKIGVPIVWQSATAAADVSARPRAIAIRLRFSPKLAEGGPACAGGGAFACSWPFDISSRGHIVVMYERLRPFSIRPRLLQHLLGYVMAHEIAHILERGDRHSEGGIMKQHWEGGDFADIETARLTFTLRDRGLIEEGLNSRFQRR